jgi:DNA polymerase-1
LLWYNCCDADCTFRLYEVFTPLLEKEGLSTVFYKIVMPLQYCLTEVEYYGVQVDKTYLAHFEKELTEKINDIMFQLQNRWEVIQLEKSVNGDLSPTDKKYKPFNINSNLQLQSLLFKVGKLHPIEKTKTGYSTDKYTLETLSKTSELAKLILEYRAYNHDKSHYVNQFNRTIDKRGRAHTDYKIHGAVTGRIISAKPNLQNIPRESSVKKIFIADTDTPSLLISADYSQVEYRVWAHYADDPQMLLDIENGLDIHSEVCCLVWPHLYQVVGKNQYLHTASNEVHAKVKGEHRVQAKGVVFGLMFGRGVKSLCEEFGLTEDEANKIIQLFFQKYPKANEWLQNQKRVVRREKQVRNLFGRLRRLPGVDSIEESKRAEVDRQCVNAPIQGGAADICSIATVRVHNNLHRLALHTRMILNIHDSLKYTVPIRELDNAIECMVDGMTKPIPGVKFKLDIEIEVGPSWQDLVDLDKFNEDRQKYYDMWGIKINK